MAGGYQHQETNPTGQLAQWLSGQQRQMDAIWRALTNLGITIEGDTGDLVFLNGNAQSSGFVSGSTGWRLRPNGDAEFNSLTLRDAIIDDGALSNPTAFGRYGGDTNTANLVAGGSDLHTGTITVPDGFTRCQILVVISIGNTRTGGAGGAPLYAQAWVSGTGGQSGPTVAVTVPDGGALSITTAVTAEVTGLTGGGVVTFGAWGSVNSTSGWSAGAGNAHVQAQATFLR